MTHKSTSPRDSVSPKHDSTANSSAASASSSVEHPSHHTSHFHEHGFELSLRGDGQFECGSVPRIDNDTFESMLTANDKILPFLVKSITPDGLRNRLEYIKYFEQLDELIHNPQETMGLLNRFVHGPADTPTRVDLIQRICSLKLDSSADEFLRAANGVELLRDMWPWGRSDPKPYHAQLFSSWHEPLAPPIMEECGGASEEDCNEDAEATVTLHFDGELQVAVMTFGWFQTSGEEMGPLQPSDTLYVGKCLNDQTFCLVDPTRQSKWKGDGFTFATISHPFDEDFSVSVKSSSLPKITLYCTCAGDKGSPSTSTTT